MLERFRGVVLVLLAASFGCRGGTDTAGEATEAEASGASEPELVEVEMEVGPGSFDLPNTRTGLAELSSYKAVLTVAFDGTRGGTPEKWTTTYEMLYTAEPAARQLTIQATGNAPGGTAGSREFMAEMDGAAYEVDEDGGCRAAVLDAENSFAQLAEPAALLIGVFGAEEAGDHYTFDERALAQPGLTEATGEMRVASPGGYITRYTASSKGDARYFGEGTEGTISWDYALTDVNQPVTIALPEDCPAGMVDAPMMPGASNVLRMPGLLEYETTSSMADAATFYRQQMPGRGWTPDGEPIIDNAKALLDFTSDDGTMSIIATPAQPGTRVQILLSRPAE